MYSVCSFYRFSEMSAQRVEQVKALLEISAAELGVGGLIILATEGINGTISGLPISVATFKTLLVELFAPDGGTAADWPFKESSAEKNAFKRFKVRVRTEIVTTRDAQPKHVGEQKNALTPEQWHQTLKSGEPVVLIDTRNYYETELGVFRGAIDPGIKHFSEFPDFVTNQAYPKDAKVLMYCTGGIRCEKAIYQMEELGYSEVYQLQGGILNYLAQYPDELFEGECFVFDQRVAVTQSLAPSERWVLCPHCGQPGDVEVSCAKCAKCAKVCERCVTELQRATCSKDCENQLQRLRAKQKADEEKQSEVNGQY